MARLHAWCQAALLVGGLNLAPVALPCSCVPGPHPPFVEAASGATVVAVVEVSGHRGAWRKGVPRYADLRVTQYLKGRKETNLLVLEGDNGAECRQYASHFSPGSSWVVALQSAPSSTAKRPVYSVSRCSESVLAFDTGAVTGRISKSPSGSSVVETVSVEELLQRLVAEASKP